MTTEYVCGCGIIRAGPVCYCRPERDHKVYVSKMPELTWPDTVAARAMLSDDDAKRIEKKARDDAERNAFEPLPRSFGTYLQQLIGGCELHTYLAQFDKRRARIERMP